MMNYVHIIVVLFVSTTCLSQSYYEDGKELYNNGEDDERAMELFTMSINANERLAESYMLRGSIKLYFGDLNGAYHDLKISKTIDSTDSDLFYYMGNLFLTLDSLTEAMIAYNRAIELNQKDGVLFGARGILFIMIDNYTLAVQDLNRAIILDSTREDFFNNRGYAYMMLNQYKKSEHDLDRAIILGDQNAIGNKGLLLLELEQYEEAIRMLNQAILIFPVYSRLKYYRARAHLAIGKIDEACFDLKLSSEQGFKLSSELFQKYCKEQK